MASDIWLSTILIVRKETCCRHIGYSFRLTARVLLYAPSHRQDSTYHGLCYTSRGALAGTRNSSMGSPHEGLIRRPIASCPNRWLLVIDRTPLVLKAIQASVHLRCGHECGLVGPTGEVAHRKGANTVWWGRQEWSATQGSKYFETRGTVFVRDGTYPNFVADSSIASTPPDFLSRPTSAATLTDSE